jgi:hypothetical protein
MKGKREYEDKSSIMDGIGDSGFGVRRECAKCHTPTRTWRANVSVDTGTADRTSAANGRHSGTIAPKESGG